MYKAEKAIIMAAGLGKRLQPITLTTPKPLVKINGVRLIDTVIKALNVNGIKEIYVVVGYLKEQFKSLEQDYPGLVLLENPYYSECNNISSLYVAREHIDNTIILDGDQFIYNSDILNPYFSRSGYNAVWSDMPTDEWLMSVEDGIVKYCNRNGGNHGWQLYSVSFWSSDDGKRLKRHLEIEFEEKNNRQVYWDDVAMFIYHNEYKLGIRKMNRNDIIEIDTIRELVNLDKSYEKYLGNRE